MKKKEHKETERQFQASILILFLMVVIISSFSAVREKNREIAFKIQKEQKDATEKIYLLGQFDPSQRDDFTVVPALYGISGYTMYLRTETLNAFLEMANAASRDGVELKIASATRNFDYQKNIWNTKWNNLPPEMYGLDKFKKILEYSAVPGTSRHHWGTEIDINNANPQYFDTEEGKEVYNWLSKNASSYGFCQPYIVKGPDRPTGYNEERWHWSYVPISRGLTQDYKNLITEADIKGFKGDQYISGQDIIYNYVLSINSQCL